MKQNLNRIVSVVLVLVLCIGLLSGLSTHAQAATVDYVYSGDYIYNWGQREETATFLSPNAQNFYQENQVRYEELATLSGSYDINSVSSSALYKKLQQLMVSNHDHITSYNETRGLYQYTDCQNSGRYSKKISSFYSGKEIGPGWDGGDTWNREHTWPNSKGSGDGENDIMMLRPTSKSENGGRGNTAYGESSGYYDPNMESKGAHNLHGDVARIMLYVYVRWGNTSNMWGYNGVIENVNVLLKWMEEDPVDTWELGRNDSVEAITGTRNVFVDYPELAFLLFSREVPSDMTTPSGKAASNKTYTVTATANNAAWGKVAVSGSTIVATPAAGYKVSGYTIVSGSATVTRSGNIFQVKASSNCTIRIDFTQKDTSCKHTNTSNDPGTAPTCTDSGYTAGTYCKDCKTYISGHATVPATGHNYTDTLTPPTATEDGFTTHTCGSCGHSYTDSIVPALGFSYTVSFSVPEGVYAPKDMVCDKNGIYLPNVGKPACDKNVAFAGWARESVADTTSEPQLKRAGDRYIAEADTTLVAVYSYTVDGQTLYSSNPTCGHSNTELKGNYRPSCSAVGYTGDTVCTDCGHVVTAGEEIAAKGHDLKDVAEKPATTEETGIAGHKKCNACGKLFDAEGNQVKTGDLILDKLTEAPPEPKPAISTEMIIGICAGALAVLAGIIFLIIVRRKK